MIFLLKNLATPPRRRRASGLAKAHRAFSLIDTEEQHN